MDPTAPPAPAVIVLAHQAPRRVMRLVDVLDPCPVVVHYDAKAPDDEFAELARHLPDRATLAPRHDARLASWSLVAAELACLRLALARTDAEHVVVMSGADYPLVAPSELAVRLRSLAGRTAMRNTPVPYHRWDTALFHDGGLWRMKFRYLTRHDQMLFVRGHPACIPIRRRLPGDIAPTASEQWKIFGRRDAGAVLDLLDHRRDLVRLGRTSYIPDESFLASLLAAPALFPNGSLVPGDPGAWTVNWRADRRSQHPATFGVDDVALLGERVEERAEQIAGAGSTGTPLLFARKFAVDDDKVLDRIERELW